MKLKLEFIVLNQLLTLVKRGKMAPCNLPALADDSKSSSDDSSSQEPVKLPVKKSLSERCHLHFTPHSLHFSSKTARSGAQAAAVETPIQSPDSHPPSVKDETTETDKVLVGALEMNRSQSDHTLHSDETDLIKVVGETDEDPNQSVEVVDDIERQYLGRYGL